MGSGLHYCLHNVFTQGNWVIMSKWNCWASALRQALWEVLSSFSAYQDHTETSDNTGSWACLQIPCVWRGHWLPRMLQLHPVLLVNESHLSSTQLMATPAQPPPLGPAALTLSLSLSPLPWFIQVLAKSEWRGLTLTGILRRNRCRDEYCHELCTILMFSPRLRRNANCTTTKGSYICLAAFK